MAASAHSQGTPPATALAYHGPWSTRGVNDASYISKGRHGNESRLSLLRSSRLFLVLPSRLRAARRRSFFSLFFFSFCLRLFCWIARPSLVTDSASDSDSEEDDASSDNSDSESESEPLASERAAASSSCCAAARASFASRSRGLSSGASPAASSTAFSRFRQSLPHAVIV